MLFFCGRRLLLQVQGDSMLPHLASEDRILVNQRIRPKRGDIVVAWHPRKPGVRLIKRLHRLEPNGMHLLGDNPSASTDSRQLGAIPTALLIGVAVSCLRRPPTTSSATRSHR
ncbi:MAG: nickel-type superoxide dismutase maturation protease [Cyanobium sp. RS427]|nr:nickel-type superoxide dismutase maturation protease [Cyanobium sp. RS427]